MAKNDDFFLTQKEGSEVKTRLVLDYFKGWSRIMVERVRNNQNPRLQYIDLYCGPGCYGNDEATPSTPIRILEHAVKTPELRDRLLTLFNDKDKSHIEELKKNIAKIPNIATLKNQPRIRTGEVDDELLDYFSKKNMVPTFSFIDPFGFKGLTLDLIHALAKSWGSDLVFFFSYNQINRFLGNKAVKNHIDGLFGVQRADKLRVACAGAESTKREELLIEALIEALNDLGFEFVIPYVVDMEDKDRTSHYLIFISKNQLGFKIMKDIMYSMSEDRSQGVARFGLVRSVSQKSTPLLALLNRPLDDLGEELCERLAGQTISRKQLMQNYNEDYPRNPFVNRNWIDVLTKLEREGAISADPPFDKRRKVKGVVTFGEKTLVTFPKKKVKQ